jgi:hypothetical protein
MAILTRNSGIGENGGLAGALNAAAKSFPDRTVRALVPRIRRADVRSARARPGSSSPYIRCSSCCHAAEQSAMRAALPNLLPAVPAPEIAPGF